MGLAKSVGNPINKGSSENRAMLQGEAIMNAREELHLLIDSLADDQIAEVRQYVEELRGAETPNAEALGEETLAAIREGLEDIQHGRVMDVQEYRRTRGL
jgi:predicted transcriptional regulator